MFRLSKGKNYTGLWHDITAKNAKGFQTRAGIGYRGHTVFVVTMGIELLQETGRLEIKPNVEHWTSTFGLTHK